MDSVLGVLGLECKATVAANMPVEKIEELIQNRIEAREQKNWTRADEIREELFNMGIEIKDGSKGTTWTRVVK